MLALDLAAGKMYWTDQGTDKIQRAAIVVLRWRTRRNAP